MITYDLNESDSNCEIILSLQPRTSSGGGVSREEVIGEAAKDIKMTSFELAQLIHSYVDSSTFQDDQSLNKLIILIPSRVDHSFSYRSSGDETADLLDLPKIPFTFKNRGYDNRFTSQDSNSEFFAPFVEQEDSIGLMGFIRSFNTTITGAEFPAVQFTLDFEEAFVLAENFLDG